MSIGLASEVCETIIGDSDFEELISDGSPYFEVVFRQDSARAELYAVH